jgi:hypothetical protein
MRGGKTPLSVRPKGSLSTDMTAEGFPSAVFLRPFSVGFLEKYTEFGGNTIGI